MKFARQIIVFGGIVVFSSAILPGSEAYAFGQQWRPASGFVSASGAPVQRVANVPAFRPWSAPNPYAYPVTYQQSRQRTPQLAAAPHTGDYPVAMRGVQDAYQPYPHYRPYQSYQAQQMPAAMMYPAPGWVQPFSDMAQAWQQQMPVFVRQLPWRPAEQPWTAQPGVQGWPRYPVAGAPRTAEFRPGTAGYPPAYGSWRPADRPPQAAPRFAYQAPVYTAPQQYGYRTVSAPAWQVPGSRMAGLNPAPAGLNRFQWRPVSGAQRSTLRADVAFRPAAYGRSQRGDERVAWRGEVGGNSTQHKLPGWVTTYEDSGFADSCSWCSGS